MTTLSREEFYSIVANINNKIEDFSQHAKELERERERRFEERDKRFEERFEEQNKRFEERDKRLEERDKRLIALAEGAEETARRADVAAERIVSSNRSLWLGQLTTILSVLAISIGLYYGIQQSNLSLVQTTLSAFQQGQNSMLLNLSKQDKVNQPSDSRHHSERQ